MGSHEKIRYMMVDMPRSEYLKHFAKDEHGNHIGTEEWRPWTAEELEQTFGKYKKEFLKPQFKARDIITGLTTKA